MNSSLLAFIAAIPEIMKLLKAIAEEYKRSQNKKKLKDDIDKIRRAFKERNEKDLNDAFNN